MGPELLAEILAHPDDDAPRLVYADALAERGDPRGELIAVQCQIARGDLREPLLNRERELLRDHGPRWIDELGREANLSPLERRWGKRFVHVP